VAAQIAAEELAGASSGALLKFLVQTHYPSQLPPSACSVASDD
jgi:hypothetical protein